MKPKEIVIGILLHLLLIAMVYFAMAFYTLELNPAYWSEDQRFLVIWFGWTAGFISYPIVKLAHT